MKKETSFELHFNDMRVHAMFCPLADRDTCECGVLQEMEANLSCYRGSMMDADVPDECPLISNPITIKAVRKTVRRNT